jgi:hypothetical protein
MTSPIRTLLCTTTILLAACGSETPPSSVGPRNDVPRAEVGPTDGGDFDASTDGGDVTVQPDVTGEGGADGPGADTVVAPDVARDTSRDAAPDVPAGPMFCAFTPEQMAVFSVRLASCTFRSPQAALNEYFRPDNWEGGSVQQRPCPSLQCMVTARGPCATVLGECLKYTVVRPAGGCPTPAVSCEGSPPRIALSCADGIQVRDDCNARQRRCAATGTESACIPMMGMGDACPAAAIPRCRGSVFEQCVVNTYTPMRDCALTGATCDAASNGCRGDGPACTGDAVSCDGTSLRLCRGGRTQIIDCGRLVTGASCQTVMGHSFCGTATECDPTTAPPNGTCDGNTLVTCAGGRIHRFVCTDYGFTSCGAMGCQ